MRFFNKIATCFVVYVTGCAAISYAAVIGTNLPAQPISMERIDGLPRKERVAWSKYLKRSEKQLKADKAAFHGEMRAHNIKESTLPPTGRSLRALSSNREPRWYGEPEALRIADIVVSFQTPAGGWSKNLSFTSHIRSPGEHFAPDNRSRFSTNSANSDNDAPHDASWSYVGTFDNGATTTQLRYLAKVISALPRSASAKYRKSFLRGLDYILEAQFPNGGWPQVWPLQGGYHDAITYNDGGMMHVIELLDDVGSGKGEFEFVPRGYRWKAAASAKRGINCILATQIVVNGQRSVWCQQHDAITLQPTAARNYEMPCKTSGESAEILVFLMNIPSPSPQVVAAVHPAIAWLEKTEIFDVAYRRTSDEGRKLIAAPGNGPIWARYYGITTDIPIFGDRDKSIHDTVNEISLERRNGYGWYGDSPARAIGAYKQWNLKYPAPAAQ